MTGQDGRKWWGRGAVAGAALAVMACGGGGGEGSSGTESGGPEAGGGSRSESIPTTMLSEGGTSMLPPAQEVQLPDLGFDYGSEDAPIKVVEFSDYGCGYCRRFHTDIFPTLKNDYIDTDRVHWKYITYVSGMFANGMVAAFAAECAGEQELFPPMSKLLYERQADWKSMSEPYPAFEAIAEEVGADTEQFRACITEQRPRPRVRSGILSGARLGVRGTPSFMINGIPFVGAQPLEMWADVFQVIEAEANREPGDGADR